MKPNNDDQYKPLKTVSIQYKLSGARRKLKELRNCILRIIHVCSLLCSKRVYVSLDFYLLFWKTRFSSFCHSCFEFDEEAVAQVFCEKSALRNFTKFTGKHLFQSPFFNKVAGLRLATLLKMRLWHRCFPVIFVKFLRPPLFTEHLRWLLLSMSSLEATYMCIVYCVLY